MLQVQMRYSNPKLGIVRKATLTDVLTTSTGSSDVEAKGSVNVKRKCVWGTAAMEHYLDLRIVDLKMKSFNFSIVASFGSLQKIIVCHLKDF